MSDSEDAPGAPGWDAIQDACQGVRGAVEPLHVATETKYSEGGPDPLDGFDCYAVEDPTPHWHVVTFGFSELDRKESDNPELSGWGFELTMRLVRYPDEEAPPAWVFGFLQNLARYVFDTGNAFGYGDKVNLHAPIVAEEGTALEAVAFTEDPELGTIETPFGRLTFLQVVGLTMDEYAAAQEWDTPGLLDEMRSTNSRLITDLRRASLLEDCNVAARIEKRMRKEGASEETLVVKDLDWAESEAGELRIRLRATAVEGVKQMLRGRTGHGRHFELVGPESRVEFDLSEEPGLSIDGDDLVLYLTPQLASTIEGSLLPQRGEYRWEELEDVVFEVQQAEIRDAEDGEVIRVLG